MPLNDQGADLNGFEIVVIDPPKHGVLHGIAPDYSYRPDPDFFGNDNFTINIALIQNQLPIFGLIYHPPSKSAYWGGIGWPARKLTGRREQELSCRSPLPDRCHVLYSMRQNTEFQHLQSLAEQRGVHVTGDCLGSAYKYCLVAEALADAALFLAPTAPWDSAAGQALLAAANGQVVDLHREALLYPWPLPVRNPPFIVTHRDDTLLTTIFRHEI